MSNISLKKNFIWAFIGNAISAFLMWLLLVVLTKIGTAEVVGIFAVAQAVSLPVSMLFSLKLQMVQVTDAKDEFVFGNYLMLRLITSVIAVIITSIIGFAFYSYETAMIIFVTGISYAIMAVRETFLGVMQKSERMDRMTLSRVMESAFSLVLFGLFYFWTQSLTTGIFGLILSRLIVIFIYDLPITKKLLSEMQIQCKPHYDFKVLRRLFKVAMPLGVTAWLGTLFTSIPRLVLDKCEGKAQVGYFAAISSLLVIGTMVTAALSQTCSPRLAKYFVENINAYKSLILKLSLIAIFLGICGVAISYFFGKWLLTIMFKPEYADYNYIFIIMTAAGAILFLYTFMNDSLSAARKFYIQLPLCVITAIACLFSSLVFIPKYGMSGAAYSIIACYLAGFVGSILSVVYVYKKELSKQRFTNV